MYRLKSKIIKVGLSLSKKNVALVSLKNDEKCFLFHLKPWFVPKILKFLSWLFGHVAKKPR